MLAFFAHHRPLRALVLLPFAWLALQWIMLNVQRLLHKRGKRFRILRIRLRHAELDFTFFHLRGRNLHDGTMIEQKPGGAKQEPQYGAPQAKPAMDFS